MAKHPAYRFRSAEDLGRALQALQRSWNIPVSALTLRGEQRMAVPYVSQQEGQAAASEPARVLQPPQIVQPGAYPQQAAALVGETYRALGGDDLHRSRALGGALRGLIAGIVVLAVLAIILALAAGDGNAVPPTQGAPVGVGAAGVEAGID